MISSDADVRISYNCNGSLSVFPFSFPLIESSDIKVILRNKRTYTSTVLVETTDYVVKDMSGAEGVDADFSNGGTVTTTIVYSSNYTLTLERNVPYTQTRDFVEGSLTLYENFESALDKLTMEIQQLKDKIGRSVTIPSVDSTSLNMEIPSAEDRANKYAYYDANGEPTAVTVIDTGTLSLSVWAKILVDSDNAAEGRAVLELDNLTNDVQAKADFTGYDEKTTFHDDDIVLVNDSEALNVVKRMSVANLRGILDEDNMASDSATLPPSQRSVKAYADQRMLLTGANLAIGSDADGDTYYRASGALARLAKGAGNLRYFMNAAGTAPEWAAGIKRITGTRALNADSGDVSYSGVGFKPSFINILAGVDATVAQSWGFCDAGGNSSTSFRVATSVYDRNNVYCVLVYSDSDGFQGAILKSFDADGFTLTWTKYGASVAKTITMSFECHR